MGEKTIGEYCFTLGTGKMGGGIFGHIYRGLHKTQNYQVAIKSLKNQNLRKYEEREDEILKMLSELNHENLIKLHASIRENNRIYWVLEYCNFGDLEEFLDERRKLEAPVLQSFFIQLGRGLVALKEKKIVHRDLKPKNILLHKKEDCRSDSDIIVKIADFGLSRFLPSIDISVSSLIGTPKYMAPEVLFWDTNKQEKAEGLIYEKADLWSLGLIMYECAVGNIDFIDSLITNTEQGDPFIKLKQLYQRGELDLKVPLGTSMVFQNLLSELIQIHPEKRISLETYMSHDFFKYIWRQRTKEFEFGSDYAIATRAFLSEIENELDFNKGDIIKILRKESNGWWEGELHDKIGWFPPIFVRSVENYAELSGDSNEHSLDEMKQNSLKERKSFQFEKFPITISEKTSSSETSPSTSESPNSQKANDQMLAKMIDQQNPSPSTEEKEPKKENIEENEKLFEEKHQIRPKIAPKPPKKESLQQNNPPLLTTKSQDDMPITHEENQKPKTPVYAEIDGVNVRVGHNDSNAIKEEQRRKQFIWSPVIQNEQQLQQADQSFEQEEPRERTAGDSGVGLGPETQQEPATEIKIQYQVTAKYDWKIDLKPGELPISKGEKLEVIGHPEQSSLWWKVRNSQGKTGLVPIDLVAIGKQNMIKYTTEVNKIKRRYRERKSDKTLHEKIRKLKWYCGKMLLEHCEMIWEKCKKDVDDLLIRNDEKDSDAYIFVCKASHGIREYHLKVVSNELGWFLFEDRMYHNLEEFLEKHIK